MSCLPVSLRLLAVADARDQFVSFLAGTHDNAYDSWGDYVSSCWAWEASDRMTSEYMAERVMPATWHNMPWRVARRMASVWMTEAERLACEGL